MAPSTTYNPAAHLELDNFIMPSAPVAAPAVVLPAGPAHSFTVGDALSTEARARLALRSGKLALAHTPLASVVLPPFAARIDAENRRNVRDLPVRGMRASADGMMLAIGQPGADAPIVVGVPTDTAWRHVADRLAAHGGTPGLRAYLPESPRNVRETLVWSHAAMADADARVSVGMRHTDQIMRVAGPRYAPIDPAAVARMLMAMLPANWRAEVSYDGEAWQVRALDPTPMPLDARVGDVFSRGLTVRGNDVREGCAEVAAVLERLKCSNGLTCEEAGNKRRRVHVGEQAAADVERMVREAIGALDRNTREFAGAWADARRQIAFTGDAVPAFTALIEKGHFDAPGKRDDIVGALVNAWNVEPGHTRADVVNAVTRAAHDYAPWWQDIGAAAEVEKQGSALVYVRNLAL